jgi:hypothetical protein
MLNRCFAKIALCLTSTAASLVALGCGGAANTATQVTSSVNAPPSSSTPQLSFVNSSNPPTNPYPQAVSIADFNGDGKLDLAVPVYSIFTSFTDMNILLGNGDGTFTAGPTFPLTGQNVNNAAVADFNGDGKPDLVLSLPDANQVQIALGNGDGTFSALSPISVPQGVYAVVTADLNGDGKPDLIVASNGITILLGKGDGTFTTKGTISVSGGAFAVAVADFNHDGKPDLAVANYNNDTVTVLLGKGDGTFTQAHATSATGYQPAAIATGDFNGDGIPDLVVTSLNGGYPDLGIVTVLLGRSDGTFKLTTKSPIPGSLPTAVSVADINGDGKADLIMSNAGSNTISVFLGKGDGTFIAAATPAAGTDPLGIAVGDFNGDGIPDLATANNTTNSVTVLLTQN